MELMMGGGRERGSTTKENVRKVTSNICALPAWLQCLSEGQYLYTYIFYSICDITRWFSTPNIIFFFFPKIGKVYIPKKENFST